MHRNIGNFLLTLMLFIVKRITKFSLTKLKMKKHKKKMCKMLNEPERLLTVNFFVVGNLEDV